MADDIVYTSTSPAGPPNATKQVTDEHATRGHMPVAKLAVSADGDATIIPGDATYGLDVDVTRVQGIVAVSGTVTADTGTPSGASTATVTDDTSVTTTAETIASNAARRGFIVDAPAANTASCFLRFGGTASSSSYTAELLPGAYWEMPVNVYTGAVSYVAGSGTQTLHVTEW